MWKKITFYEASRCHGISSKTRIVVIFDRFQNYFSKADVARTMGANKT